MLTHLISLVKYYTHSFCCMIMRIYKHIGKFLHQLYKKKKKLCYRNKNQFMNDSYKNTFQNLWQTEFRYIASETE